MKKKNFIYIALIIIFSSLLVLDPLLRTGIFTAHDIETNMIYFGSFYSSLMEGNLVPRWSGNIANLYGSPTNMFFYPLSYYLASPIRLLGFSLTDTMKIYLFLTFVASCCFMYLWLKNHLSEIAAFTAAFLYAYAPYRINDIYARGSVAENTSFVFVPLVAYALYTLWQKPGTKRIVYLSLVLSALVLSHPFLLIIFIPFYVGYCLFLKLDRNKIKMIVISGILTLLITAFYIIPLILENKYTHYDISPFRGAEYFKQFVSLQQLILPVWTFIDIKNKLEYQTYQVGIIQIALFIISFLMIGLKIKSRKINKKILYLSLIGLINFLLSVFFMLPISNLFYRLMVFLQRIEFPWRFMSLNFFSLAILTACMISGIRSRLLQKLFVISIIIGSLILYLPHAKGHDYKTVSDNYYLYQIKENTDAFATLPRWAAQPDVYPRIPERYQIIEGEAEVTTLQRISSRHIFEVEVKKDTRFLDATFYFPGWRVYLDRKPIEIEFQNPDYRGLITVWLPIGKHNLEVVFTSTKVRLFADMISLLSIFIIIFLFIYGEKFQKNFHRYSSL